MNKVKFLPKIALAAGISLAMAFIFSCSSGGSGSDPINPNAVTKEKITGLSQKGPFAQGSAVKLYELNENLQKTSAVFQGTTTDNNGNFEININKELVSPYVILEVSGKYANEVSGQQSNNAITLSVITDIKTRNSVNINVLTHLEYNRVQSLLASSSGISFEAAKHQAQEEVLTALGMETSEIINSEDLSIFGSGATDSLLLLASIFVQGERSTEEVSNLLAGISNEIKETGTLSDEVKSEVANSLANVDWSEVVSNIQSLDQNAKVPDIKDIEEIVKEIDQEATPPSDTTGNGEIHNPNQDGSEINAKTYAVTFNAGNGSFTESGTGNSVITIQVKEGEAVSAPANPSRSGYSFVGWNEASDDGIIEAFNFNSRITKDITLYAEWKADESGNSDNSSVATPTANPPSTTFKDELTVYLKTTTDQATIYYTIDGLDPVPGNDNTNTTTRTYTYANQITVTTTTTIKAVAVLNGVSSGVMTEVYTLEKSDNNGDNGNENNNCSTTGTAGCGTTGFVAVTSISANISTQANLNQTVTVNSQTIRVNPTDATNQSITWAGGDNVKIEETSTGDLSITYLSAGTATITATIAGGATADGQNYVQTWTVQVVDNSNNGNSGTDTSFVAVTGITAYIATQANLYEPISFNTPTISPSNATYKDIVWSSSTEDTKIETGNGLVSITFYSAGTATITATIQGGGANGQNYTQTWNVTVVDNSNNCSTTGASGCGTTGFVAVTSITADISTLVNLNETVTVISQAIRVAPTDATNQSITWTSSNNVKIAETSNGLEIIYLSAGTATITATIAGGATADGQNYVKTWTVQVVDNSNNCSTAGASGCDTTSFVAVTGISANISTQANLYEPISFTPTISPSNATNTNIVWSADVNDTKIETSNGLVYITFNSVGNVRITATIQGGGANGQNYTQSWYVTVVDNSNTGSGTCTGGEAAGCSSDNSGNTGTGSGNNGGSDNSGNTGSGTCTGGEAAGCAN